MKKSLEDLTNQLLTLFQTFPRDPIATEKYLEELWLHLKENQDISLPLELCHNEVFLDFLSRKQAYDWIKKLQPFEFSRLLHICLERIRASSNNGGDDHIYFPVLERLQGLYDAMNDAERLSLEQLLARILDLPYLSPIIYLNLLTLITEDTRTLFITRRMKQWKHDFLAALKFGDTGSLCDCLCFVAYLKSMSVFAETIQIELQHDTEITPYLSHLTTIDSLKSLPDSLKSILLININKRLPKSENYLKVDQESELGAILRKLYLLELAMNSSRAKLELELVLAIEQQDLQKIEKILDASDLKLYASLSNGISPISIATQIAIFQQTDQDTLEFYLAFHRLVDKQLEAHPSPYKEVINIFEQIAFSANDAFSFRDSPLVFGKWDDPTAIYTQIMQIYLPDSEHSAWLKYCPPHNEDLHEITQSLYQGSQEVYGLWFHLMSLALVEELHSKANWESISHLLGYQRNLIACFIQNIQIPREYQPRKITFATQSQQQSFDKMCPGSPLNFGVLMSPWEEASTTMLNDLRELYLERTAQLIQQFNMQHSAELTQLTKPQIFEFKRREIQVFPVNGKFAYSITCPFYIDKQRVTGTHLLWNWPGDTSYFYPGHFPARTSYLSEADKHYRWLHATGTDKIILRKEAARLFGLILESEDIDHATLARFFYVFFQAYLYRRGSAAIGIVILNTILRMHGKSMPGALKPPSYWDCEAMCSTETEFTENFGAKM